MSNLMIYIVYIQVSILRADFDSSTFYEGDAYGNSFAPFSVDI